MHHARDRSGARGFSTHPFITVHAMSPQLPTHPLTTAAPGTPCAPASPDVQPSHGADSTSGQTHRVLVALVRSYISLVRSEWPAVCRRDPDFSVETAHNYGLGLIRMLAEFQVANGIDDRISVELALELSDAKHCAESRVREPVASTAEPKPGGAKWRRGYRRSTSGSRSVPA